MKKIYLFIVIILILSINFKVYGDNKTAKIAIFSKYLKPTDFTDLGTNENLIKYISILPPLKLSEKNRNREKNALNYLNEQLLKNNLSAKFMVFQIRKFDNSRNYSKIGEIFEAIHKNNVRFVIDLRNSDKIVTKYGKDNSKLDNILKKYNDIVFIESTGDCGRDLNSDGVIDSNCATGEFIYNKNIISVGGSENYLPIDSKFKKYENFNSEPFKSDLMADSFRGIAAFSGRGRVNGRIPTLVSDCTAIFLKNRNKIYNGTIFGAINVLIAALKVNDLFIKKLNFPFPSSSLIKATLISMSKNCYPGQYGTGKYLEIIGRPDKSQGFGKINIFDKSFKVVQYLDDRIGLKRNERKTLEFSLKKRDNVRGIVVLTYPDFGEDKLKNKFELSVIRSDKKEFKPTINTIYRNSQFVELTFFKNYNYKIRIKAKKVYNKRAPFALMFGNFYKE